MISSPWKNLTFIFILLTIAVFLLISFSSGFQLGFFSAVIFFCLGFAYKYPRRAIWTFLIYLPFSDTVTYWIGNGNFLFTLIKDALYFPALIAFIQEWRQEPNQFQINKALAISLSIFLGWCLLIIFLVNGTQENLAQGIIGLKVLMGYIPLIFCAYYLIRDRQDLLFLMRLLVVLTLICCTLGFLQFVLLKIGICAGTRGLLGDELLKATLQAKCFVGGALVFSPEVNMIHLPGTFASPWQWGWFLIANSCFMLASAVSDSNRNWQFISLITLGFVLATAIISGQKMILFLVPLIFLLLLALTNLVNTIKWLKNPGLIAIIVAFVMGIFLLVNPEDGNSGIDFIVSQFQSVIEEKQIFIGHGLGTATNAARIFGQTRLIETFYPKMLYEIGIFGVLIFLAVVTNLIFLTGKCWQLLKNKNLISLGICLWVFVLFISYNTLYYPLDVNPVGVYYWFLFGVLLKLPELDTLGHPTEDFVSPDDINLSK